MTVLGFSSSANIGGNVDRMVQAILIKSGETYEFYNLTQLSYGPCRACVRLCAGDNLCKLEDDLKPFYAKILSAKALILGTPTYHSDMNGFMRLFLERMWPFRHLRFPLKEKPFTVVASGFGLKGAEDSVESVKRRMTAYRASFIGSVVFASSIYPCYTCGYGKTCQVGSFYKNHGKEGQKNLKVTEMPKDSDPMEFIRHGLSIWNPKNRRPAPEAHLTCSRPMPTETAHMNRAFPNLHSVSGRF